MTNTMTIQNHKVIIKGTALTIKLPNGDWVDGFITETGSYGSKNKTHYIKLKVADKEINLKQIIKENK